MKDVRSRCVDVFARVMDVSPDIVTDKSDPENLAQWDSLTHVQMIVALEKEFSVEINPEEGIDFENFKMIYDFILKKLT